MQDLHLTIKENTRLTDKMWKMVLCHPDLDVQKPGQFINLKIDGYFLRRPISVCDAAAGEVTIIYAVVGKGTKALSEMETAMTPAFPERSRFFLAEAPAFRQCTFWQNSSVQKENRCLSFWDSIPLRKSITTRSFTNSDAG